MTTKRSPTGDPDADRGRRRETSDRFWFHNIHYANQGPGPPRTSGRITARNGLQSLGFLARRPQFRDDDPRADGARVASFLATRHGEHRREGLTLAGRDAGGRVHRAGPSRHRKRCGGGGRATPAPLRPPCRRQQPGRRKSATPATVNDGADHPGVGTVGLSQVIHNQKLRPARSIVQILLDIVQRPLWDRPEFAGRFTGSHRAQRRRAALRQVVLTKLTAARIVARRRTACLMRMTSTEGAQYGKWKRRAPTCHPDRR